MPVWALVSVPYFLYVAIVAALLRGLPRRARWHSVLTASAGLSLCFAASSTSSFWLRLVLLPPVVLLVAYWSSGLLWVAPMERVEGALLRVDRALRVPELAAWMPRASAEVLELAYAAVYPLIPIALALHLAWTPSPDADYFWTVVLVTDFVCFGMLPWIQTRPPRWLREPEPWHSELRAHNLQLLGRTSIGVNTMPSGHAAEAAAAALLVIGAPWPVVLIMGLVALAISAGAVLGRYHYAVDALAGWLVALAVWMIV